MTLAILVLAATVIGGEVGPFVSWDDVTADEKHTPGSEEFYDEVDEMTVYDSGIVYRNGTVVTNVPFPAVVASMEDDSDYGWCYDVSQSIGHGESFHVGDKRRRRIRMNQFDLTWFTLTNLSQQVEVPVRYYAYGTGCVKKAISPPVVLPVSRRLDEETRAAVLASYEAYAERLYWGSKGDSNNWDTTVFGRTTPGPGFKFNYDTLDLSGPCTNHFEYAYPTNDVRLLEHTNFVALAEAMKRIFPSHDGNAWAYDDIYPNRAHPAWIYRPGWLQEGYMLGMWWSSSKLPRMEPQPLGVGTETYTPDPTDFTLLPTTGWTNLNSLAVEDAKWACRAFTLDALDEGNGFHGQSEDRLFPCTQLLGFLIWEPYFPALPRWKTNDTIPDYLTNVYSYASKESLNPTNAFNKYLQSWNNDSHRLTPSAYSGVNQLLAVMDRTITIPVGDLARYYHQRCNVYREATYAEDTEPTGEWDGDRYRVHVAGRHTLGISSMTNSVITTPTEYTHGYCYLSVDPTDNGNARIGYPDTLSIASARLNVGYDFFYFLCQETGWDELIVTRMWGNQLGGLAVECVKVSNNKAEWWTSKTVEVPFSKTTVDEDPFFGRLKCFCRREYEYHSSYEQEPRETVVQPPADAGDRVHEAKYALAWLRQFSINDSPYVKAWKFDAEEDYTRAGWPSIVQRHAEAAKKDLDDFALGHYGVDYSKPDEFAPLPQSVTVNASGDLIYKVDGYTITDTIRYPEDYYYTKERYRLDFFVPEYGIDVTNLTATVSNIAVRAETAAFVKEEVAPDGWRWVTEAYTNVVSETQVGASGSTDEEVVTAITYGVTNIVTKYRWAGDVYPNVERREWTNHMSQTRLTTIVESDHYGFQTNVVIYYDDHLTVTNVTTNVTALAYLTTSTNVESRTEWGRTEFKEWEDHYPYPYPYGEIRDDYEFLVNEYIYDLNGMAYWVFFDPMTGEMVVTMHGGVPYPLHIGSARITLVLEGPDPFKTDIDWPPMPSENLYLKEQFHSIHRVDWNWKSMHDKGN